MPFFFTTSPTRTVLELNPVLQSKKPATGQGNMTGVTQISFQGDMAIIFNNHGMFFVLFASDVGELGILTQNKAIKDVKKSHSW